MNGDSGRRPESKRTQRIRKENAVYKRMFSVVSTLAFLFIITVFGAISILDTDKTTSEVEKRSLAEKPKFSFSALFDGSYTQHFEEYYADTFPFRDQFISISKKISGVFTEFSGSNDTIIYKDAIDNNDMVGTGEGVTSENNETDPQKTEPNTLAQNDAPVAEEKDIVSNKSSIIIANKRAMNIYYRSEEYIKKYSDMVNKVADNVQGTAKVYSLIAPTSIEMYGTKTYRTGVHSQREGIETAYRFMSDKVTTVDAYSSLVKRTDEYIYFRTDHHWTARGAYLGYTAFCASAGLTPVSLDVLETGRIENFVGTFYGYTYSQILKDNPDYVEYFLPRCSCEGVAYTSADRTDGWKFDVVNPKITASNKYMAFIAGDQPLEVIKTNNQNGKKIMVIKESYGNALVPFLCDNYQEIYVVDPRSVQFNLPGFLKDNGIGELLFVNYTFSISNTEYINKVNTMLTYTKS